MKKIELIKKNKFINLKKINIYNKINQYYRLKLINNNLTNNIFFYNKYNNLINLNLKNKIIKNKYHRIKLKMKKSKKVTDKKISKYKKYLLFKENRKDHFNIKLIPIKTLGYYNIIKKKENIEELKNKILNEKLKKKYFMKIKKNRLNKNILISKKKNI